MTDRPRAIARTGLLWFGRLTRRVSNACTAAAGGTLRIDELRAAIVASWDRPSDQMDDLEAGLFAWEQPVVERFFKPGGRVLVIGSGFGRDLVALARRGFTVTGIEPGPNASTSSRAALLARGLHARVIHGYVEDVGLEESFDAIVFSYFAYGYIPVSQRRVALLARLAGHLAPGGSIAITYNARIERHDAAWVLRAAARASGSDWRPERGDRIVRIDDDTVPLTYEHLFTDGEIAAEAEHAGLRVTFQDQLPGARVLVVSARTN